MCMFILIRIIYNFMYSIQVSLITFVQSKIILDYACSIILFCDLLAIILLHLITNTG